MVSATVLLSAAQATRHGFNGERVQQHPQHRRSTKRAFSDEFAWNDSAPCIGVLHGPRIKMVARARAAQELLAGEPGKSASQRR